MLFQTLTEKGVAFYDGGGGDKKQEPKNPQTEHVLLKHYWVKHTVGWTMHW